MSHIQELVEKLINKMSAIFLLLLVSILYLIWTVGLNPPTILFIYDNAAQLVTFFVGCLFLLNLYKVKRNDLFFIAAGIHSDFHLRQCQKWPNEKMKSIMNNNCHKKNAYKTSKKDYLKNG